MSRCAGARDPGDLSPLCSRSLELRAFTFIHGREAVHHHSVRHRLRLHGGAVPDDAPALPARDLQHDRPRRVNLIAANASSGESTDPRYDKQMLYRARVPPESRSLDNEGLPPLRCDFRLEPAFRETFADNISLENVPVYLLPFFKLDKRTCDFRENDTSAIRTSIFYFERKISRILLQQFFLA